MSETVRKNFFSMHHFVFNSVYNFTVNDNSPVFEKALYRTQITEEDDRALPKRVLKVSVVSFIHIKFSSAFTHPCSWILSFNLSSVHLNCEELVREAKAM